LPAARSDTAAADQTYPADVVSWLREDLQLATGCVAIDLGAGAGKFTINLAGTGVHVVAVEPVDATRDETVMSVPAAKAMAGTAQAKQLPDSSTDSVVCAQPFHIIHAVGPIHAEHSEDHARELLRKTYASSIAMAAPAGCPSIAFPAISTGINGYPPDRPHHPIPTIAPAGKRLRPTGLRRNARASI